MDAFQAGARAPLFFMHIPKTAGMSMRLYLGQQYHPNEIATAERWQDVVGHEDALRSFRLVRGHFRYNLRPLVAEDARMLVVLREPMHRTVSALRHLRRDPAFHETHELAKHMSLAEMIRHPGIMSFQKDVQARFLCASATAADVAAYLGRAGSDRDSPDAGDMEHPPELQLAAERLEKIEFVGLTEGLDELVAAMAHDMGYHPPLYFPSINQDPAHLDPLYGLDEEALSIIRAHNVIDTQLYDLARRLIARRIFERRMRYLVDRGFYRVPPGSFEVPLIGPMPGSGWYDTETAQSEPYRWTGPSPYFTIEVPLRDDASYRMVLKFHDARPIGPEQIQVEINDLPVVPEVWPEDDMFSCEVVIDQTLLASSAGFCRVRIDAGETVMIGSDIRLLGIMVRQIEFICLE